MSDPIYIVVKNQHGALRPAQSPARHRTAYEARAEAKRLAAANPGIPFLVFKTIGEAKTADPVQWTEHAEAPF